MELDLSYRDDGSRGLIVVSFDPGVTTGWAVHRLNLDSLLATGFVNTIYQDTSGFALGQIYGDGSDEAEFSMVHEMLDVVRAGFTLGDYEAGDLFAVVMEDFILRMQTRERSLLAPVRVFSRYEMLAHEVLGGAGVTLPYFKQSPSDALNVISDARLKRWNVYDQSCGAHARDAQRHGILFARKVASVVELRRKLDRQYIKPRAASTSHESGDSL